MYGDPQQRQQNLPPPQGGEFQRGPPLPPPQMMRQPSASSTTLNSEYQQPAPPPQVPPYDAQGDNLAAKRMKKLTQRRAVDYTSTVVRYMQIRMSQRDSRDRTVMQPTSAAAIDMLPTAAYLDNPSTSFAGKFVHTSLNKNRCSINRVLEVVAPVSSANDAQNDSVSDFGAELFELKGPITLSPWTPTGRRLITGCQSGEFTLWNGQSFNFEMILQAHEHAIRSMVWSHNDNWMVSGDDGGVIKYWQNNMNNVKANKSAHKESVRDLSFCRTDLKFCSCSDDNTVKVWDFARCQEEHSLTGHGWDVKSADWHPTKSLLVSGGKDNLVKLWDAKTGRELCSFHGHKNNVLCVKWNQNGNWLLTAGKDQIIKLYDIRAMKELGSFRGHRKDVTVLAWHPFHEEYFVSGGFDGTIFHWLVGHETTQLEVHSAHDNSVWDIAWHPIGYLLCSGSNDHTTKFWCRNRPGDTARDKFSMGQNQGYGEQNPALAGHMPGSFAPPEGPTTPGPFAAGLTQNEGTIPGVGVPMLLDASTQGDQQQPLPGSMPFGVHPLPPGPHPSLVVANQPQGYQQNPQQIQQHQMPPIPMGPPNMQQLQPPSHMPLLPHPHLQRPSLGMPSSVPSSVPPQSSIARLNPMGIQGTMNQMPPSPQGHFVGMNTAHSAGGFPSNMQNMLGQMYPQGSALHRPQMPLVPGFNPYQSGLPRQPPPPGPSPHGQTPQ